MFSRSKNKEVSIAVKLEDTLTSDSCAKIIIELIKYILYQKQQIPFSCDTLAQMQLRFKPHDKNYSSTKALFNTLDAISNELTKQLHMPNCDVKEVVIAIGATMISPKFCIRVELPENILSSQRHMEYQHSYRKPLLTLMRTVIECAEFQEAMTVSLGPTNTFVLVRKSDRHATSEFFLPKPHYSLPLHSSFFIKLCHNEASHGSCRCLNLVKVYCDNSEPTSTYIPEENLINDAPYLWYQSKEVVKGFKYQR